ncbi:MAG: uncharacterized protein PWP24_1889 [Clostridiales bacterium]|nr:uncharacterized protein [Clostridiales bacterium]
MKKSEYEMVEQYMLTCMTDCAHDKEHVYRVLYNALEIAQTEQEVDYDVLISACLLHDIGRKEQFENPDLCHAMVGAEKAYTFLRTNNFSEEFADNVQHCIKTHRYRNDNRPESLEAKILFDADKLDVTGAIGIARTLLYKAQVEEPLYTLNSDGSISNGENDERPSFFQEYKYKLEKIYNHFYTNKGKEIAKQRQKAAIDFYNSMLLEVESSYEIGRYELTQHIDK